MTCLKACPHRSVEVNLRPPAIDLWTSHEATAAEVCLLFLLLGAVVLHRLPLLLKRLGLTEAHFWLQGMIAVVALALPGLLAWGWHQIHRQGLVPFVRLAYGYLPLVLGANLAYYLPLGLGEAGQLLPVTFATFGLDGTSLPSWQAHPAVIGFLQTTTLVVSTLASLLLSQKIARSPLRQMWHPWLGILALAWGIAYLL